MASSDTTITINPLKSSDLEFELTLNGSSNTPIVRFVIINAKNNTDYSYSCKKKDKKTWMVSIPKLDMITGTSSQFRIECIIDDFYFEPAQGTINYIETPSIKIKQPNDTKQPNSTPSSESKQTKTTESIKSEEFNISTIAKDIVGKTIKSEVSESDLPITIAPSPSRKKLFSRDEKGHIFIPGLENSKQKERVQKINDEIKQALKQ